VSGRWNEALDIGERSIQIEPFWEHGHRRIMRSWRELGERHHALRHYAGWAACLAADGGDEPDLATQRLFVEMRGR
jgi:DNA-binding SARP family transcriptional activator